MNDQSAETPIHIPRNIKLSSNILDSSNRVIVTGKTAIDATGLGHFEPESKVWAELVNDSTFAEIVGFGRHPIRDWHTSGQTGVGCQYHFRI